MAKFNREKAKAAGMTDEQINSYLASAQAKTDSAMAAPVTPKMKPAGEVPKGAPSSGGGLSRGAADKIMGTSMPGVLGPTPSMNAWPDIMSMLGQLPGPQGIAIGAGGRGGGEALRQGFGAMLGIEPDPGAIALQTARGAAESGVGKLMGMGAGAAGAGMRPAQTALPGMEPGIGSLIPSLVQPNARSATFAGLTSAMGGLNMNDIGPAIVSYLLAQAAQNPFVRGTASRALTSPITQGAASQVPRGVAELLFQ